MRSLGKLLSVLVLLGASATFLPTASASAAVETGAVFNDPTGSAEQQRAIDDRVIELIKGAEAGSQVKMSMFYAQSSGITDALREAHQRGVQVQAVFDNTTKQYAPYQELAKELGEDAQQDSFAIACPEARGCIGDRTLSTVDAINHNKFFLFSRTSGTPNVVVQSSANLNEGRDGTKGWNNALVLANDEPIYQAYDGYFADLVAQQADSDYYNTRTPVSSDKAKIHFFPRQETDGADPYNDPDTDQVMSLLNDVQCTGNSGGSPTAIRVNQHIFSRGYLADKLVALDEAGCEVQVAANYNPESAAEQESLEKLLARTDNEHGGVDLGYYCTTDNETLWTHSKYIVLEGKYNGTPDRKLVWTGSANWSTNSLRQSDETDLRYEDDAIVDDYSANFAATSEAATHKPDNGDALSCS